MKAIPNFLAFGLMLSLGISQASPAQEQCSMATASKNAASIIAACQTAADEGDPKASTALAGAMLSQLSWLNDATLSDDDLRRLLAQVSIEDTIVVEDAKNYLEAAVEHNLAEGQYWLGLALQKTRFINPDFDGDEQFISDKAHRLLVQAADQRHPKAMAHLVSSIFVFEHDHVVSVLDEYEPYLRALAKQAPEEYQGMLKRYEHFLNWAEGIAKKPQDFTPKAVGLEGWRLYSGANRTAAQKRVGWQLLQHAATRGDGLANYQMAKLLKIENPRVSLEHLQKAASAGQKDAAFELAEHLGCQSRLDKASHWYQVAIDAGHVEAEDGLDEIKTYGNLSTCS